MACVTAPENYLGGSLGWEGDVWVVDSFVLHPILMPIRFSQFSKAYTDCCKTIPPATRDGAYLGKPAFWKVDRRKESKSQASLDSIMRPCLKTKTPVK